ncbi:hypothetical protein [Prauserella cavernicola]|uniref:Uncharacterized protein n=1 Tax=Prauserella cavernicola TaxID=2800127 RepID=A0A934QUB1_9PSEU|nr:hypothetical protein [Prauserella cavernicola]MBK1786422.1 hypothetical protein [Prauserella cavernicola]
MGSAKTRGRLPGRPAHQPESRRVRPPWLRPRALAGVVAGVLLAVAAVLVLPSAFGDSGPDQDRVAELQEQERQRDTELTRDLVTKAEQSRAGVTTVLEGLEQATESGSATADDVARWREAVREAAEPWAERPSGGTEVNLARSGFAGAVTVADRAVETFAASQEASGELAERLRALAGELHHDAVSAWSVAATQLDVAGVAAGLGHVHVFLAGTDPHGHGG